MADDRMPLSILSDQPADEDRLNFDPYAKTLADIIVNPNTDTPLTIGVFGDWGRGKTSLMRMVRRRLEATADTGFPVRPVWFNAWLYSREQALWRALISRVLEEVRTFPDLDAEALKDLDQLEGRLYSPIAPSSGHLTLPPDALPRLGGASLPTLTGLELLRRQAKRQEDEAAAAALGDIGPQAVPALIEALAGARGNARRGAILALGWIGPEAKEAAPLIIQALGDQNEEWLVRSSAARALGSIEPDASEAVPVLLQALGDESEYVRAAAAEALGDFGSQASEAVPALIEALGDEHGGTRSSAARALRDITGQDFGEDADRWREWWEQQ